MKKSQRLILFVAVLATLSLFLANKYGSGTLSGNATDFVLTDTASIDKICLLTAEKSVILRRTAQQGWDFEGTYNVNQRLVQHLLYTSHKMLIQTPVSNKRKDEVVAILLERGVKCELWDGDDLKKSYYIGVLSLENMKTGTYAVLLNNDEPYEDPFMVQVLGYKGFIGAHYNADEHFWRDKTVFSYDESEIASIKVEHTESPSTSYELRNTDNAFTLSLLDNNELLDDLDNTAVNQYLGYFFNLKYSEVDTIKQEQSNIHTIVTVTDTAGVINRVAFSDRYVNNIKDPTHWRAQLSDGENVTVPVYQFGKIAPEMSYFQ